VKSVKSYNLNKSHKIIFDFIERINWSEAKLDPKAAESLKRALITINIVDGSKNPYVSKVALIEL